MPPFWLTFEGRGPGCVEAENAEEAKRIAKELTGCEVLTCQCLPYPASPRINEWKHPKHGVTPPFCYRPSQCAGRGSCPQSHSCVD